MKVDLKETFIHHWNKFFPGAELPLAFYYSPDADPKYRVPLPRAHRCLFADLAKARKGKTVCLNVERVGCRGGKRYLGFDQSLSPDFDYFLSCGIPGKLEGERYKKSPELVNELMKHQPAMKAPEQFIVFKRFDLLDEHDDPAVVIFFAPPDVLSGLFTLANFDEPQPNGVFAPFCAGCASIVHYPYQELVSTHPRAVLGLFDVSARPYLPASVLSFAVPWPKFVRMVENVPESFLITPSWQKIKKRL
ncbi:DUF169 domain-containing protein [bacterium]|nr:DUF169 domain-containing protein [bacterium]